MGERTGIEWTDMTWNPWRGCTKVSPGCAHCYMFREQKRYGRDPSVVVRASSTTFNAPLKWEAETVHNLITVGPIMPRPPLVFTCSWSDFFHEAADPWRAEAWAIIRKTADLTYQILTKRPERIRNCLPPDWGSGYPNVWLGTSVESQSYDGRIRTLLCVPAKHHFLSAEPLIGPLELGRPEQVGSVADDVDWVIVGGESGTEARPMEAAWVRGIRAYCVDMRIPFFFKQWGGPAGAKRDHGDALLDGKTWKEMPV